MKSQANLNTFRVGEYLEVLKAEEPLRRIASIGVLFGWLLVALILPASQAQTPATNGAVQTGILTTSGQTDSWVFGANSGDSLFIRVGSTNFTPKIELFAPGNTAVTNTTSGNAFARDGFLTVKANATGNYTVLVSASFAGQTGSYGLNVAVAPGTFTVSSGDEGGDLKNGAVNSGVIDIGDLDMWSFSANAGDNFFIRMGATNVTPWIRLYGPTGALVGEAATGNGFDRDDFVVTQATASGTYTVVASAKYAGQTGGYTLTLAQAPEAFQISEGDEGGELKNGAPNFGTISLGDLDMWSVKATAGDTLFVRMGATNVTPWIRLYDPSGGLAGEANSGNGFGRDDFLTVVATNSGNYTVVVSAKYSGQSGGYQLSLADSTAPIALSSGDEGGVLTNGVAHVGTIALGDLDLWSFSANAGDALVIRMGATNVTPWIRLYGPTGLLVGEAQTGNGFGRDDFLTAQATNSGTYTVVVSAKYSGQFGDYSLTLAQTPGLFTTSTGDQGGPLTNGIVNTGAIDLGDLDMWSLNAVAGQSLFIRMGTTNFTPWIQLYGPDGALVGEAANGNGFGRDDSLTARATNSGAYTIVVSAKYSGQTGTYGLSLAQVPDPLLISAGDEGGALTNGLINLGTLALGDLDAWSFFGTPGDSNVLRVASTNFTPWIRLYGPDGALLQETLSGNGFARAGSLSFNITNAGNYTVVLSASFAGQSGTYSFKQSRVPPDLNVPDTQILNESETLNVSLSAQDPDQPVKPLVFNKLVGPAGLTLNNAGATNASITWPTTEADGPSTNLVVVTVTDTVNGHDFIRTNSFTVVVQEINTPPQLTVPADQTLDELTPLNVSATATDADLPANPLTFSLLNAPTGLVIDPKTGAISWTPTEAQGPNTYLVQVVVTDSSPSAANERQMSATNSFKVVVREVNLPPQLTVPSNQVIDELTPLNLAASATDPDLPANTLTFTLAAAPEGMNIDPVTGTIHWTPSEAQGPSTNIVTVKVQDDGSPSLSASKSFTVVVKDVNTAPVLATQIDRSIDELTTLVVTNTATDTDLPVNHLTYTLIGAPTNAVITAEGVITWTPTEAQGPSTNVFTTIVRDDGTPSLSSTNLFIIIVKEVNLAPVLQGIADQSLHYGTTLTAQAQATDADVPANQLTFTIDAGPTNLTINATSGAISWTPTQAQVGTYPITVRVTDNGSPTLSATTTFRATVAGEGARLDIQRLASQLMQINITADTGYDYELQQSMDATNWTKLFQFHLSDSPFPYIDPDSSKLNFRLYRLKLIQSQ